MEHLLVVDDDEFERALAIAVLEQAGYQVDGAEDGLLAWEKIDNQPGHYDMLLLDKNMPGLDGISLLKRIKQDPRFKDMPVVMFTGDDQRQDVSEGLAAGAHYYLIKPSPADILKSVVRNALAELGYKRDLLSLIGHQTESLRILRRAEFRFRTLDEAKNLALWLADASMDPGRTVNAYSEILINAVEHGNLAISYGEKSQLLQDGRWADEVALRLQQAPFASRYVEVFLDKTADECRVTIKDQGDGFDWRRYLEFSAERAFDLHGRGIAMSRLMGFDGLEYQGNGNTVLTSVKLSGGQ